MNEIKNTIRAMLTGIIIGLLCGGVVTNIIGARRNSERFRQAESELDRAVEQLAISQRQSIDFAESIGQGLDGLKIDLTDGTRIISERIRAAAQRVAVLEDTLRSFRDGSIGVDDRIGGTLTP